MSKGKSKEPTRITRENFKRPKNRTNYNYKQWLNNFMDLNNWSQNKGRPFDWDKKIGRRKIEYINSCLTCTVAGIKDPDADDIKKAAITRSSPKPSKKLIETHLETTEKELYLYYCNTSYTDLPLFCIDLDALVDKETGEIITTIEDLKAAEEYISKILPSYYAEPSTRGQGLHYYFHIDFTDCWNVCCFNESSQSQDFEHYADLVNHYALKLSHILKEQVNSKFKVDFDAIKGTMSRYIIHSSGYPIIDRSGIFCKLPRPHNQEQFNQLVYLVPVSFDKLYSYISNNPTSASVSSSKKKSDSKGTNSNKKKKNTTVCGDFLQSKDKISIKSSKNEDIRKGKYNSADVITRSREVGKIYFRNYWKEYNKRPSCEEYRKYYRKVAGTGAETQENKERLEKVYKWLVEHFDSSKISKSLYTVGEFIPFLSAENITDEQLDLMRRAHTKYRKKIRLIDLDLMLGHFFLTLMSKKDDKTMRRKSLTCPTKAIPPFFKSQKTHYKGRRVNGYKVLTCGNCKAKSIKILLEKLGLLRCIDPSYSTQTHTSMRWFLTKKFPRYRELENYLGKDFIDSFTSNIKLKTA